MDRDPAEVGVPVALGIQADSEAWGVGAAWKSCVLEAAEPLEGGDKPGQEQSRLLPEQIAWGADGGQDWGQGQRSGHVMDKVRGHSLDGPVSRALTQQHSRDAPAQGVVEAHGTAVHVAWLDLHAVEVQPLHEQPREGAEEEVVQEDGDRGAQQLKAGEGRQGGSHLTRPPQTRPGPRVPPLTPEPQHLPQYPAPHPGHSWSIPDLWPRALALGLPGPAEVSRTQVP